ncbi:NAD(P)-binding protein [Colletotrichum falcatum]|nr:NAD(P)-binding protein [Colletotrichum falcatum]
MRVPEACVAPLSGHGPGVGEQDGGARPAPSLAQGAGLISNGSAALATVRAAKVCSGQRVLVNGASGSVGHVVAQLCRSRGASVVGVASGANETLVRGFADQFVDYKKHASLPDHLASAFGAQPFDSIIDCVGSQALYTNSPKYLRPEGPFVNVGALDMEDGILRQMARWFMNAACPAWLGGVPRRYIFFSNTPSIRDALTLVEMVEQGGLKVILDSEFAMTDLVQAYDRVTSKRARGKVLVRVREQ